MRRLQFKFPSQIRISGWDFGSSARAMNQAGGKDSLMTYESVNYAQAEIRTVRISTTERKTMSTKTTIKQASKQAIKQSTNHTHNQTHKHTPTHTQTTKQASTQTSNQAS